MPFNGSGTFTRDNGTTTGSTVWADDRDAGTLITAANHDTHDEDIATALSNCICKDGQTTITANIPFNNKKITGLATGTARTDGANLGNIQDNAIAWGGTSGGTANAHTITLSPAISSYVAGMMFSFIPGNTNTGSATLNVNGVGAVTISNHDGSNLSAGQLFTSAVATVVYNGTVFKLVSSSGVWQSWTPTLSASGSMTYTSTSITYAKFTQIGGTVFFQVSITGTVGGTPSTDLTFTLPINFNSTAIGGSCVVTNGGTAGQFGHWSGTGSGTIVVRIASNGNWSAGTGAYTINGCYST